MKELEEGLNLTLDFSKIASIAAGGSEVVPVAVQNADTREVILVAYCNEQALKASIKTRTLVLWSTSRNKLWIKGEESGEKFDLLEARVNCEQNSLLFIVRPRRGGICHTRNSKNIPRNCYYRRINFETMSLENLDL
jgi:phosphoribosyl-AMP cyclohydrolase